MAGKSKFSTIEDFEKLRSSDLMLVIMFIGGLVLLLLGGALWGVWDLYDSWDLSKNGLKTTAVVTKLDPYSTKRGTRYHPIVTFSTNKNTEIKVMLATHCKAEKGYKVEILYDPEKPDKRFKVNTPQSLWYSTILFIVVLSGVAYPFWRELRKMLIAGQLIKDPRVSAKPRTKSSQPSIAELNRQAVLPEVATRQSRDPRNVKQGQKPKQ